MIAETVIFPLLKVAVSTVAVSTTGSSPPSVVSSAMVCFCKQGSLTNKINDTDIIHSADENAVEHFDNLFKNKEYN